MYNVLEKLRAGESLTDKERLTHEMGLVSVLKQIHDELDRAVFDEPQLDGVVAVAAGGRLLLHDDARPRLDDRHGRDRPVRGEELRHPDLLTDDSVNHHEPLGC